MAITVIISLASALRQFTLPAGLFISKPTSVCRRLDGTSMAEQEPVSALAFNGSASLLAAYSGSSGTLRVWSLAQSWTQSVAQRLRGLEPTLPGAVLQVITCESC